MVSIDTVVLNPVTTPSLFFEFYLSDGLINDNAAVAEINNVVIGLPNGQFAQYTIDFATNKVVNVTKPDFKLLYPGGVAPSSTEEIRIPVE